MTLAPEIDRSAPDPAPGRAGGLRAALSRVSRADRIALITILGIATIASTWNILGAPAFRDDEGTYTAQAISVQNGDLAPYTYWYDHPPFGWIQLAVLGWVPKLLGLGGGTDIGDMRFVVAGYFIASALLVYLLARRVGGRVPFSVLATGVFILSPLSLMFGRQVYLDTITTPWLLLAFYFALSPRRQIWHHAASGLAFAIAVLTKLTAALFGPALLLALLDRLGWRNLRFPLVAFLSVGSLAIAVFPLMSLLRGELISGPGHVSLQDGLAYQFLSRSGSGWIWDVGSARAELIGGWMHYDAFIIVGGAIAGVICLATRRTRWIFVALATFSLPIVLGQGYMPAMYIVAGIPFLALACGVAAQLIWDGVMRFTRTHMSGARQAPPTLLTIAIILAFAIIPAEPGLARLAALFSVDENADWRATRDWVAANLPKDEVVLAPYSIWQDLDSAGWNDPWTMIVLEKVDLDSQFDLQHPRGWQEIRWIVEGPTVQPNLGYLGLTTAADAFDHSIVVRSFGSWHVRQVVGADPPSPSQP